MTVAARAYHKALEISAISTRNAHPALFAVTMGTGGISNLFVAFPYGNGSTTLLAISLAIFFVNLFLFTLFFALLAGKYIWYPDKWRKLVQSPVVSLYVGTFPMGATTLINTSVSVVHEHYHIGGEAFLYFLWGVWWIDVVIAFACAWIGVHVMFTRQSHSLESMTAMWLLPVVTLIVAASTGGIVANSLAKYSALHALQTATVSAFMVTVGVTLAFMIFTIYLLRLIIHGLPPGASVLSVFLPLGPAGQSGYGIMLLGQSFSTLFPPIATTSRVINTETAGNIFMIMATSLSFVLWSLATMWVLYALLAVQHALRKSTIPYRISFWGLVFPNAVYANLTISLSKAFDSPAFRVWGAIYAISCLLLWVAIALRSLAELKPFYATQIKDDRGISTPDTEEQQ